MYLGITADMVRIHFFPSLRNGVKAKFSRKWMAAREALCAKPDAAQHAKALDSFVSVPGAGWLESATSGKKHGQIRLVATKGEERSSDGNGVPSHGYIFRRRRKSAVSSSKGAFATVLFG